MAGRISRSPFLKTEIRSFSFLGLHLGLMRDKSERVHAGIIPVLCRRIRKNGDLGQQGSTRESDLECQAKMALGYLLFSELEKINMKQGSGHQDHRKD